MKSYLTYLQLTIIAMMVCSCAKDNIHLETDDKAEDETLYHDEIVLGTRLENPYSVDNVKSALASLYPTKAAMRIDATDLYVRFLPADDDEYTLLKESGLTLSDHPVDYEILRDGDYYHDPQIEENSITWQYAVVPVDFEFPDIRYEILESCFISENSQVTKSVSGIDWDAVECESFRISGNSEMLSYGTKAAGDGKPSGRITIVDEKANGGQPVGVAGVKVQCNVFVKFASAYTDRNGYYQIPKKFTANPRYRLVFINEKGFGIGFNSILYPASTSTLGKGTPDGVSVDIDRNSERKLFRRSVVNNAAYDFYERCGRDDLNLTMPPADLRFWMFDNFDASSAVMLHHGTVLDPDSEAAIYKAVSMVVGFFSPDITLGSQNLLTYDQLYSSTVHEMSHACHFTLAGRDFWNNYILYIATCELSGQQLYGNAGMKGSGVCAVGEMWAYAMERKFYEDRYGQGNATFGTQYWFHPQIITYLDDRGLSMSDIQKALTEDVTDVQMLRQKLVELYPSKKTSINQVFNRYE